MIPVDWQLKIDGGQPVIIIGAHDALSALIAYTVGCDGIWWSSLGISLSSGVPDRSIINPTDVMLRIRTGVLGSRLPHIVDGDAGYGGIEQLTHAFATYQQVGVCGISIEDYLHPKVSSLVHNISRTLCSIDEMCGRIKALRDNFGTNPCLIARTESIIVNGSIDEALYRASKYAESGCDAIIVHNNTSDVAPLWEFSRRWQDKT